MLTINLRDAKAGFSSLVDGAIRGEFVTITRHGKPVAALVSVEAAELARKAMEPNRAGLVAYGRFPAGSSSVTRRRRGISIFERVSARHQRHLGALARAGGRFGGVS